MSKPDCLQCYCFCVDETPYAVWNTIPKEAPWGKNIIDVEYLQFLLKLYQDGFESGENTTHAATALRHLYGHVCEIFFAVTAAILQHPHNIIPWLLLYKVSELKSFVSRISEGTPFPYVRWKLDQLSWDSIAKVIYPPGETEKMDYDVAGAFSQTWKRASVDFTSDVFQGEYNSVKHGLRTAAGGILSMQVGDITFDGGKYGSHFFVANKLAKHTDSTNPCLNKHQYEMGSLCVNWVPESMITRTQILIWSLANMLTWYRHFHDKGEKIQVVVPPDGLPVEVPLGLQNATMPSYKVPSDKLQDFQETEVRDWLKAYYRLESGMSS